MDMHDGGMDEMEDDIPELRYGSGLEGSALDSMREDLRRSKGIRQSLQFQRTASWQAPPSKVEEVVTETDILFKLGGQDFENMVREFNERKKLQISSKKSIKVVSGGPGGTPPPPGGPPPPPGGPPPPPGGPPPPPSGGPPPPPGGPPPPPGAPQPPGGPPLPPSSKSPPAKPLARMTRINWQPIRAERVASTVWETLPEIKVDEESVRKLFTLAVVKVGKKEIKVPKVLNVLDATRSQSINFALKRFKFLGNIKNIPMDCFTNSTVSKEEIEMLQKLYFNNPNIEEELNLIETRQEAFPGIPLGVAEQFIIDVNKIPNLKENIRFWIFKIDLPITEQVICSGFKCLKDEIDVLKKSRNLIKLLSVALEFAKIIDRKDVAKGFELNFLAQMGQIKDTQTKKTLLHHVLKKLMEMDKHFNVNLTPESSNNFQGIKQIDYSLSGGSGGDKIVAKNTLDDFEEEYKCISGDVDTNAEDHVQFLNDAIKRIVSMKRIHEILMDDYMNTLDWLGIPSSRQQDYSPDKLAELLISFDSDVTRISKEITTQLTPRQRNGWK